MKKMVAAVILLFLISSQFQSVEPDAFDCYDACSTGCVQSDTRLMQRCDRKCSIRCGPDSAGEEDLGGVRNKN